MLFMHYAGVYLLTSIMGLSTVFFIKFYEMFLHLKRAVVQEMQGKNRYKVREEG